MAQSISGNENFSNVVSISKQQNLFNVSRVLSDTLNIADDFSTSGGLTSTNDVSVKGHLISNGDSPTAFANFSESPRGVFVSLNSTDVSGTLTLEGFYFAGDYITVSFTTPFDEVPVVGMSTFNAANSYFYISSVSSDQFVVTITTNLTLIVSPVLISYLVFGV